MSAFFLRTLRLCLLALICFGGHALNGQVLRVHSNHSRLLEFRGEPVILKTLGEHYGSVINPDFNYIPYLNTLHAGGMNLTRVVLLGFHSNSGDFNDSFNPSFDRFLQPWPRRTSAGYALDGRGKWDLSSWNEAYFTRLRSFVQASSDRGIIVELTLFSTIYFADLSPATSSIDLLLDNVVLAALSPVEFTVPEVPMPLLRVEKLPTGCRVVLTAQAAGTYLIEWSEDLLEWETMEQRVISEPGEVEFTDTASSASRRFYRASAEP